MLLPLLTQWRGYCLLVLAAIALVHARSTPSTTNHANSAAESASSPPPTCPSGSVNYITQTLAQQCVASNRTAASWPSSSTITPAPLTAALSTGAEHNSIATESETGAAENQARSSESSSIAVTQPASSLVNEPDPAKSQPEQSRTDKPVVPDAIALDEADNDQDSPLDTANFLSFEEWKRKNLEKAGQSPEHVGQHRPAEDMRWRARPGINNALDVLGEDSEIELDFSGFGAGAASQQSQYASKRGDRTDQTNPSAVGKPTSQHSVRSKDAGKTCKERTNYASFDCAASVLKTNPECKSASSVLVENKDSYMLNICKVENKFFIVELCDDILIDTLVLANYEFFSSIFRTFRLSVSDRYPVKEDKWRDLGVYEARNTREVQAFLVEEPLIWARYLRIEILTSTLR